ncbi:Uncharacterized conserved protein YlxW, UPF0749 family [Caldanaerobius fijiensis DSM 17918]|uniref:Uncharacterized conserved protein YlxW, UPF0749 family n=1 Tax=Caldanaerobius fijiensis DSM 17918 TaxID=1121256 RepID=A0A1M5D755_9THEO|nr:DUF881 domain-containing protein [Caldanaerobius fijiensis]SHF62828.1 Uncharacterized conserved protein YlxW, UPF0749 family [Caldanaerobius fijiensis DSM 17918]
MEKMRVRIKKSLLISFVVAFLLLYSSYKPSARAIDESDDQNVISAIVQLEQSIQLLEDEINDLKAQIEKYKQNANVNSLLISEKEKAEILAGITDVQGPGIIISLNDSKAYNGNGDKQNYIVHDIYIQQIVNVLKTAGAEAISINGQRIIATSEIICMGPTVSVNKVDLVPPYIIKAIGNADVMLSSLNLDIFPYLESLKEQYGLDFSYQKNENIQIPKYSANA